MKLDLLLKDDRTLARDIIATFDPELVDVFNNIRCPLCAWQPSASSRWYCDGRHSPEPAFDGCGAVWNTFLTRGHCPGCSHQWQWTSCHRCAEFSRHEAWYETR